MASTSPASASDPQFFHLPETHMLIDELSQANSVVIYVGAGASIERTGLSWAGLSAQLLDPSLGDYAQRIRIVRASTGAFAVSSAIAQQFQEEHGLDWREHLTSAIREQLYAGDSDQTSYFNDRVIALADAYIRAGKQVAVATPNYDQFLLDALSAQRTLPERASKDVDIFKLGIDSTGDPVGLRSILSSLDNSLHKEGSLPLVFLHGFVSRSPSPGDNKNHPVVSERDYALTRKTSQAVLGKLFKDRTVIVVGSSITDPPLIHALVKSLPDGGHPRRFVVRPLQDSEPSDLTLVGIDHLRGIEQRRARHLGVQLVTPPHFFQAPQILEETRIDLAAETSHRHYSDANADHRYGGRLLRWWHDWLSADFDEMEQRQDIAYQYLSDAVPIVKGILRAPKAEHLKIEAWVRWEPENRELARWASSTGNWPNSNTMRRYPIDSANQSVAIRTFLNGAPTYSKGNPDSTRWESFLAKPIRLSTKPYKVFLPVGVISLASLERQDKSCLNPKNKAHSAELFVYLDQIGEALFSPDTSYPAG